MPDYLSRKANGVWYFQRRTPLSVIECDDSQPAMVRRSTNCTGKREALKVARLWTLELESQWNNVLASQQDMPRKKKHKVQEAIDEYLPVRQQRVANGTYIEDRNSLCVFRQLLQHQGVTNLEDITDDIAKKTRNLIARLPFRMGCKAFAGDRLGTKPLIAKKTIGKIKNGISSFLKWADREEAIGDFERIRRIINAPSVLTPEQNVDSKKHELFSHADFFNLFRRDVRPKLWYDYKWFMLITLHTGFRMSEIIGLHVDDNIQKVGGIEFISLQNKIEVLEDGRERTVGWKADSAMRNIPVARKLYDYGWRHFIADARDYRNGWLFNERERLKFSKSMGYFMRKRGVVRSPPARMKDTISFRHQYNTVIEGMTGDRALKDALSGHESVGRSTREEHYVHFGTKAAMLRDLEDKKELIDQIDHNLDDILGIDINSD